VESQERTVPHEEKGCGIPRLVRGVAQGGRPGCHPSPDGKEAGRGGVTGEVLDDGGAAGGAPRGRGTAGGAACGAPGSQRQTQREAREAPPAHVGTDAARAEAGAGETSAAPAKDAPPGLALASDQLETAAAIGACP